MSSAIDDFYDFHKDVVKNTSTGLMAIRDLATYYNVLVDIHLSDHRINITVRSKEGPLRLCGSFYYEPDIIHCAYEEFGESDDIYYWIAKAAEQVKGGQ